MDAVLQQKLAALYKEIEEKQKEMLALKHSMPAEEIQNYTFKDAQGNTVDLLSLFKGKDELLLIHNMGKSCVYCTMWADCISGMYTILKDRVPTVLTSPDEFSVMKAFAESRNWQMPYYSYHGTNFSVDLGFAYDKEGRRWYQPGVSSLFLKDGKIFRKTYDFFGPGDLYCAPWHFFDLLNKGVDGWEPKYKY